MGRVADEVHVKKCMQCGSPIKHPLLYKGYLFCSGRCKDRFLRSHGTERK